MNHRHRPEFEVNSGRARPNLVRPRRISARTGLNRPISTELGRTSAASGLRSTRCGTCRPVRRLCIKLCVDKTSSGSSIEQPNVGQSPIETQSEVVPAHGASRTFVSPCFRSSAFNAERSSRQWCEPRRATTQPSHMFIWAPVVLGGTSPGKNDPGSTWVQVGIMWGCAEIDMRSIHRRSGWMLG